MLLLFSNGVLVLSQTICNRYYSVSLPVVDRDEHEARRSEASQLKAQLVSPDPLMPLPPSHELDLQLASPELTDVPLRLSLWGQGEARRFTSSLTYTVTLESLFQLKNNPFST
jgi:hypothetical protein